MTFANSSLTSPLPRQSVTKIKWQIDKILTTPSPEKEWHPPKWSNEKKYWNIEKQYYLERVTNIVRDPPPNNLSHFTVRKKILFLLEPLPPLLANVPKSAGLKQFLRYIFWKGHSNSILKLPKVEKNVVSTKTEIVSEKRVSS